MEHAQLESAVTDIVRDLAEVDTLVLDTDMAAADLPGWDSFTHVEFIAALEDPSKSSYPCPKLKLGPPSAMYF